MTSATYADLLTAPANDEPSKRLFLDPVEALKLVKRIRKVDFFLRIDMPLNTQFDEATGQPTRAYDLKENLMVSAAQVEKVLQQKVRFNELKAERGQHTPGRVEVARLGNCLFFG
jgi:hypothetical protein